MNVGFVSICNRVIALTRNHFIILNTDVELPRRRRFAISGRRGHSGTRSGISWNCLLYGPKITQSAIPRRSKRYRLGAIHLNAAGLVDTDPDDLQITGINVLRGLGISAILNVLSAGIAGIAMIGS